MRCESCQVLYVNGVRCHETGCPDAWKDEVRECKECGGEFEPSASRQQTCSEECVAAYEGAEYRPGDGEEGEDEEESREEE